MGRRPSEWEHRKEDAELAGYISTRLELPLLAARVLVARGIRDVETAYEFLNKDLSNLKDPFLFSDMETAVTRISKAVEKGEGILIHGDYDVDGISSTALMVRTFRSIYPAGNVRTVLPSRYEEGYGLSRGLIEGPGMEGADLIVTVDCGIRSVEEVDLARERGVDVVVTDHHEPGEEVPRAVALIDPKANGERYPFKDLAGVGVAFKLASALMARMPSAVPSDRLLDMVALGTVGDLVPLVDENRVLVSFGLSMMARTDNLGLLALFREAELDHTKGVSVPELSFKVIPRINAAGRLGSPDMALDLLLTDDRVDSDLFARELSTLNFKRQSVGKKLVKEVLAEISKLDLLKEPTILVAKEGWNPGVLSISANRIMEDTGKPTMVLSIEKGIAHGSGRAPPGFDLVAALHSMKDMLLDFGGHEKAAGLTVREEDIPRLRKAFSEYALSHYPDMSFVPTTIIDLDAEPGELSEEEVASLEMLGPFGMGNPSPVIGLTEVSVGYDMQRIGDGSHLKFTVGDGASSVPCIWFSVGDRADGIRPGTVVSMIGVPELQLWGGRRSVRFKVLETRTIG